MQKILDEKYHVNGKGIYSIGDIVTFSGKGGVILMSEYPIVGCNQQRSFVTDQEISLPLGTKWNTRIFGYIGSPVISKDKIFFTYPTAGDYKQKPGLCALERRTGKKVWELILDENYGPKGWKLPPDKIKNIEWEICYHAGCVYSYDGIHLYCVAGDTGEIVWKVRHDEFGTVKKAILNGLLVHNDVIYGNGTEYILAVDPVDGALLWSFKTKYHPRGVSIYNERMYFADLGLKDQSAYLYCLDLASRQLVWKTEISKLGEYLTWDNDLRTGGASSPFPVIFQGRIYMSLGSYLACFNAETGDCLWKTLEHFIKKPVSDGKRVYGFNGYKSLLCFDAETGELIYESEDIPFGGSQAQGMPLLAGKTLFVGTIGYLYAFDTETGKRVWEFSTGKKSGGFVSQPVLLDGCLYAGDSLGHFYCFVPQK